MDKNGKARYIDLEQVTGFFEQVGRNTPNILHPEEILAENAALLISARNTDGFPAIPIPDVLTAIEQMLVKD